jgi:hypothetical protein
MSSEHTPNAQEIQKQKAETYQALSAFHETRSAANRDDSTLPFGDYDDEQDSHMAECWECKEGAITYAVPMDPAAGLKKGIISKPYKSAVQIQMNINRSSGGDLTRKGLRLVEKIQIANTDDVTSMPFVRSIELDANVDVDAEDGSYSLDVSMPSSGDSTNLPLLPPSMLTGLNPGLVKFLVEHTIAVSDTERCRCFFVYGDADRDGVKEDKYFDDEDDEDDEDKDEDESSSTNRNYRLIGVVLAEEYKKMPIEIRISPETPQASTDLSSLLKKEAPSSSPSPLDLLRVDAGKVNEMSKQEKMDALYDAIGKHNERVMANSGGSTQSEKVDQPVMKRYSPSMFNLCSGVYLGDTFIREPMPSVSKSPSRGFGKLKSRRNDGNDDEDKFANWSLGVQKTTLRFQWDYSSNVIQSYTYGKCIGAMNQLKCNAMSRSTGNVVIDKGRATQSREEKRVIWYLDGSYLAGLVGTCYFRVSFVLYHPFVISLFQACTNLTQVFPNNH